MYVIVGLDTLQVVRPYTSPSLIYEQGRNTKKDRRVGGDDDGARFLE